ncbi:MAG: ATP phosphoribosyltransferase regulatory subunit [Gammaproteobacteria bacterium]|nr:MAG: ATP phosphoribosyltransferase regulatory subunit [Gammaproteobacteria bacterium]RLA50841.1 MAG: ATP phosphoribosyltransferase regulatory subunit [Gammaproteobacteria bacterium]
MTIVDRWLLPEGIEEILPNRAIKVERLRRRLLDLYHSWGYDLVIPPLAEFTESLLSGSGADLDLMTCKIIDQLSGRMMGVRADITPQVARMDAHSLQRKGPNRLCYAGQVLYARPKSQMETRSPIQLGVELFGEGGLEADTEVVLLLIETLKQAGVKAIHLDLGHVGIYRGLEAQADLSEEQSRELFTLLQIKDASLQDWVKRHIKDPHIADMVAGLPALAGSVDVLPLARELLANAPDTVLLALEEITSLVAAIERSVDDGDCDRRIDIYLDLGELRGYHYHTGVVFAAYTDGSLAPLGNGGRYDHIGEVFGRPRSATGFGVDLGLLATLVEGEEAIAPGIFVPHTDSKNVLAEVARLRERGERVVCGFSGQVPDFVELHCDRQLVETKAGFALASVSAPAVNTEQ